MGMLTDFHLHTTCSDGKLSMRQVIDLYGHRGYDAIAVTDHLCEEGTMLGKAAVYLDRTLTRESFRSYIELIKEEAERAWRLYKMIVLPGYEITKNSLHHHRSAHILAVGIEEYIPPDWDVVRTTKRIRELGGLAIAAHPISMGKIRKGNYHLWDNRLEFAEHFDAWEITDNGHLLKDVLKSGLPKIANSDFHSLRQSNAWRSEVHAKKHPEAILDSVRQQKINFRYLTHQ